MANYMLQSKGLSLKFWEKAINYANYIVNHTPTKVLNNITLEEAWSSIKLDISHFRVFGSAAWAHIPDEKQKALEPKSEKSYEPSSGYVPPLSIPSTSKNISSLDDNNEDNNHPPPSLDPPSAPQLPKWVCATRDVAGDPTDHRRTCSQFDRASSLLDQASTNYDPDTFAKDSGHLDWDATMNEEYRLLLENDTWDLVPLLKGQKLVRCKWVYRTKFGPYGKVDKNKAHIVAKVFSQVEGIDYTETFSSVVKMNSIHLVLSLAASFKWEVH
eukprot:PITA_25429